MKRLSAVQDGKKHRFSPVRSVLSRAADQGVMHSPVRNILSLTETDFIHDFSGLLAGRVESLERKDFTPLFCPMPPMRYPFGRAIHTCPQKVQTKLKLGQPGDKYEQEADRMANQVVRMSEPETIQEFHKEKKGPLTEQFSTIAPQTTSGMKSATHITKEVGIPLAKAPLMYFENLFGHDLTDVRIHIDTESHNLNLDLETNAFTIGHDIYFRQGEYNPTDKHGKKLIAHELTHVLQQCRSPYLLNSPLIIRCEHRGYRPPHVRALGRRKRAVIRSIEIEERLRATFIAQALNRVLFLTMYLQGKSLDLQLPSIEVLQQSPNGNLYYRALQRLLLQLGEFIHQLSMGTQYGILAEHIDLRIMHGQRILPDQTHLLDPFTDFLLSNYNIDISDPPRGSWNIERLIHYIIAFEPHYILRATAPQTPPQAPQPQSQPSQPRTITRAQTHVTNLWIFVPDPQNHPETVSGFLTPYQAGFSPLRQTFELLRVGGTYCYYNGNRLIWLPDLPQRFPNLQPPRP
jgi:hypothetical protein